MSSPADTARTAPGGPGGFLLESGCLIYPPGGIGLIWSPKSACTTALLWYLAHLGMLEAAATFSRWPHNYRMKVLPELEAYKQWLAECDPNRLRWVRVVRNPFFRAVSSYRHALRWGFENEKLGEFLGFPVADRGFSFGEMLAYLAQADNLGGCDPHLRPQWYPFEAGLVMSRVVNADRENLLDVLCEFADPGDEPRRRLAAEAIRIAGLHHASRVSWENDCSETVFQPASTGGEWPDYQAFLNPTTRRLVERIYRDDFEHFGRFC